MFEGQIVYFPYKGNWIRYKIKKVCDNELLVFTFKSDISNWISAEDVLTTEQFIKVYKDEKIYE